VSSTIVLLTMCVLRSKPWGVEILGVELTCPGGGRPAAQVYVVARGPPEQVDYRHRPGDEETLCLVGTEASPCVSRL